MGVAAVGFAIDWRRVGGAPSVAAALGRARAEGQHLVASTVGDAAAVAVGGADLVAMSEAQLLVGFDGRLDDSGDLCRLLRIDPDASPGRTIGEAYLRWGIWLPRHIRGDYAFVIWDGRLRRIVAARDPFGIRPLHYAPSGGQLWLASDVDQFLAAGFRHRKPDDEMVVEFLTRNFRTLDRSYFREIARVPPGSALWAGPLRPHTLENVGESELRAISVELKNSE